MLYSLEEMIKGAETPEKEGKAEIIIAKNRAGALKSFDLSTKCSRFDNISSAI